MLRLLAAISALSEKLALDPQKVCSVGRVRFPKSREERALMAAASMRETRVASSRPTERTPIEKLRVRYIDVDVHVDVHVDVDVYVCMCVYVDVDVYVYVCVCVCVLF